MTTKITITNIDRNHLVNGGLKDIYADKILFLRKARKIGDSEFVNNFVLSKLRDAKERGIIDFTEEKYNKTMKLNEKQLRQIVKESLNELDWKTYANAAKKRLQQYRENPENKELWDKWYELNKMANQRFDDDYVGTMKYDTLGDKWKGKHSPKFDVHFDTSKTDRMPYGAVNGYNKGGNKIFSTDKGRYHSPNGITTPKSFFRDQEVADKFEKANDELWNYDMGNYDYTPEKGWHLKESQLRQIIRESLEEIIKKTTKT